MGWTLHMIMCVLLCYPVSIHMSQLLSTGRPISSFLISSRMSNIIKSCSIKAGYRSDHSIIELEIILNKFIRGKGLWKFNNSLLKDQEYLTLVNKIIAEEIIKYVIAVYNNEFVANYCNYGYITLTIDLESTFSVDTHLDLLEDKKVEFEQIRKLKLKGELVRSRIQWLSEGEKPSKYFCII